MLSAIADRTGQLRLPIGQRLAGAGIDQVEADPAKLLLCRLQRAQRLVYAVRGQSGTVIVNAGTGLAAEHLDEVTGAGKVTVLLTHHFRDHTDGALRLADKGARVIAPYWDQEYFLDPEQHFRERQIWNSYDNRWDRFGNVRVERR